MLLATTLLQGLGFKCLRVRMGVQVEVVKVSS